MSYDIHNSAEKLESYLNKFRESDQIPLDNKHAILKFANHSRAQGNQPATIMKDIIALVHVTEFLGKSFESAKLEDIVKVCSKIENTKWTAWTKRTTKITLKKFYKWLRGSEYYPDEVRWIKTSLKLREQKLPDILTEAEVLKLVQAADNPRDKAIVMMLYESGCRIGEILSLRISNVHMNEYGATINVSGKTGARRILLLASAPLLAQWLENHPLRDDADSPLWVTKFNRSARNENGYAQLGYAAVNKLLDTLAKKAKIGKRIHPHLFRHTRATHLANKLTEAQMKQLFGWTQGSRMADVYVHLSGRDVDHALLELHGLAPKQNKEERLRLKSCPRCQERNSPDAVYCKRCAFPLDAEAMDVENKVMNELTQNPRASKYLRRIIREIIVKRR